MTRKDYERIARVFAEMQPEDRVTPEWSKWYDIREHIADTLADDNDRFDKDRFTYACSKPI